MRSIQVDFVIAVRIISDTIQLPGDVRVWRCPNTAPNGYVSLAAGDWVFPRVDPLSGDSLPQLIVFLVRPHPYDPKQMLTIAAEFDPERVHSKEDIRDLLLAKAKELVRFDPRAQE